MAFLYGAAAKYGALGNTFLICESDGLPDMEIVKRDCYRYGADGFIVVKNLRVNPEMTIFNSDGSRAETCGNGLRCVAAFCAEKNAPESKFVVITDVGKRRVEVTGRNPLTCKAELGKSFFFDKQGRRVADMRPIEVTVKGRRAVIFGVNTGVPHAVIFDGDGCRPFAKEICEHETFKHGVNVDFVRFSDGKIEVNTFERGVGWTKACGTGGGAVFAVCRQRGLVGDRAAVYFDGGRLDVEEKDGDIFITSEVKKEW